MLFEYCNFSKSAMIGIIDISPHIIAILIFKRIFTHVKTPKF